MVGGGGGSKRVMYAALLGNLGIAISKLVAAFLTDILQCEPIIIIHSQTLLAKYRF